ncbi:MAG: HAD hydrolase family protein [Candidatus Delongbacteria bacterium]|nr:HAD hydrolase family protein [Candidatus Delongbacteria bacterium]MCG2760963.1 HAD hydrolase family protein [Candidatus Delongbacteria bacterium]
MTDRIFHIGIDLHGTLINNNEFLSEGSENALKEILKAKPNDIKLYICTGNDLLFVKRKLGDITYLFDGAVLETGCVVSTDMQTEEIIVPKNIVDQIKILENTLLDCDYPEVYKFARRLSTISMFTRYEYPLEDFHQKIKKELKYLDYARVTRSSVAVDIIPAKHDKYNGLEYFGKGKDVFVAVADSLNDIEWLKKADISFMPNNADLSTIEQLAIIKTKKPLSYNLDKKSLYVSDKSETFGVIEILKNIFDNYKSFDLK